MSNIPVKLVTRHYDSVTPLLTGEVLPGGVDLQLDCDTPMGQFLEDSSFQAGELSISQYVRRLAAGDTSIVALPIFINRGFRHRNFFVRDNSNITTLSGLAGKRIGTNGWPDTGNVWSRSLLRDQGIDLGSIEWLIGPIDDVVHPLYGPPMVNFACAPSNAQPVPEDSTLVDLLLNDSLDVLIVNRPPEALYHEDSQIRRLFPDFRAAEEEYAAETGFYPCHHVIGVRSSVFDEAPWVASSLFIAFEKARRLSADRRLMLADTAPWLQEELEAARRILGPDFQTHGADLNRDLTAKICDEIYVQQIIDEPVDPSRLFADVTVGT